MRGKAWKRSGDDSTGDASDSDKGPPKKKKAAAAASEDDDIAVCDVRSLFRRQLSKFFSLSWL